MIFLGATAAHSRGDEWAQFGGGKRIEVDAACSGTFASGTIVKVADDPIRTNPGRKRYTVKLDQGHQWSFPAPDFVAPCVRASGGTDREHSVLGPLPLLPGVYECNGQNAVANPMMFGLIDGKSYISSGGRRGRYSYDPNTGILSLDPGAARARFQRISANTFRPLLENGTLGSFSCPLNRAKNPQNPPW